MKLGIYIHEHLGMIILLFLYFSSIIDWVTYVHRMAEEQKRENAVILARLDENEKHMKHLEEVIEDKANQQILLLTKIANKLQMEGLHGTSN